MTATIAKPITSPATKTALPTLTPLDSANAKIVEAKREGRAEVERLRVKWMDHRNGTATIPANASLHEEVAAQMAYISTGNALRSASQNFRPEAFESALLDVPANRGVLEDALRYLKSKHAEALKPKPIASPAVTPKKKNGFITAIEGLLGDAIDEPAPTFPAPRPPPQGGLFGAPAPLDVAAELDRLEKAIAGFPIIASFEQLAGDLNSVNTALAAKEPPTPMAQRMDKPYVVPLHLS